MAALLGLVAVPALVASSGNAAQAASAPKTLEARLASATRLAEAPNAVGYWLVGADGAVYAFGGAHYYGGMAGLRLNSPITGIVPSSDGRGYWLVAKDGGVFSYGDAPYVGSQGGTLLTAPIVGMAALPSASLLGPIGPAGPQGAVGLTGATGAQLLSGTTSPTNLTGYDGDFFYDTTTSVLFGPKSGGLWPGTGTSLLGATGAPGAPGSTGNPGAQGPVGPTGANGAQGPVGPTGADGAQGPAGATGPAGPVGATTYGKFTATFAQPAFPAESVELNHIVDSTPDLTLLFNGITVTTPGNYLIDFSAYSIEASQFALFDNGTIIDGSSGAGAGNETINGSTIVALAAGDVVSLQTQNTGVVDMIPPSADTGPQIPVASITLELLG
ncbi:MAG TPA: hypothetical protein VIH95_09125 [Acidimicrobiales bacterium]